MKFLIFVLGFTAVFASPRMEPELLKKLKSGPTSTILSFSSTKSVLESLNNKFFATSGERAQAVFDALNSHAIETQTDVQKHLYKEGVKFQSFWISNEISIPAATEQILSRMSTFSEIVSMTEEKFASVEYKDHNMVEHSRDSIMAEWGVEEIRAPQTCDNGNCGDGARVCIIDTGVRGTHEALEANAHSGYNWFDPEYRTTLPGDTNGHGTHCTGAILGLLGIGVAHKATWQGCVGCPNGACPQTALNDCAQFAICPHDPTNPNERDCSQHAHLVSNSWGGGRGQTWYDPSIEAWRTAGIIPVFAQGNSGVTCGSANSPGDSARVIGVGSIAQSGSNIIMSSFSSRGPTFIGNRIKPDIAAPGSEIRSAWHLSDTAYNTISGTSMACPHVAGAVALLKSKNPGANFEQIIAILATTANKTRVQPTNQNCGGVSDASTPNNNVGSGLLNCEAAYAALPGAPTTYF